MSKQSTGLVSIMMPVYNAEAYVGSAIDSVLEQRYENWELIIVDDGSTDSTAQALSGYHDSRITIIEQPNGGEAVARNTALDHMSGDYCAFLDADDLFLPDHLSRLAGYLHAHPERDAVYCDGIYIDENDNRLMPLSTYRRGPFEGWIFEEVVRASDVFAPPICVMVRRRSIEAHHTRYDPEIVIGPDWDFFTRLSEFATFGYVNERTCLYRVHQTNVTVRTGRKKRAGYLARCREKAIKTGSFNSLSEETRFAVFYDLLVNHLTGQPERQRQIIEWPEFTALSLQDQASLLRLMASQAVVDGEAHNQIGAWFNEARRLNPSDHKGRLLSVMYGLSPSLCRLGLRVRQSRQPSTTASPFGELV